MLALLPFDVLLNIQTYLHPLDIRHLAQTSKFFSEMFEDKQLWKTLYIQIIERISHGDSELESTKDICESFIRGIDEPDDESSSGSESEEYNAELSSDDDFPYFAPVFKEFPKRPFPSSVKETLEQSFESFVFPDCFQDRNEFLYAFLCTFRTFWITSFCLLMTLIKIYSESDLRISSEELSGGPSVKIQILRFIHRWIEHHFCDFDCKVVALLDIFLNGKVYQDHPECQNVGKSISGMLRFKVEYIPHPPTPIHTQYESIFSSSQELARQLTLIDFELFRKIEPFELILRSKEMPFGSCHLSNLLDRFEKVGKWITTLIISETSLPSRVQRLAYFIEVAQYLLDIQNYHTMFSVMKGLQHKAIKQLKHSKDELPKILQKSFRTLSFVTHPSSHNYEIYRKALQESDFPQYSVLPLCELFLVDCKNIEMRMEDTVSRKDLRVNWQKRQALYLILNEFQRYKEHPFPFAEIPELRVQLETEALEISDDRKLMNRVSLIEPKRSKKGNFFSRKGKR